MTERKVYIAYREKVNDNAPAPQFELKAFSIEVVCKAFVVTSINNDLGTHYKTEDLAAAEQDALEQASFDTWMYFGAVVVNQYFTDANLFKVQDGKIVT